jgi:adenylylsulfate reductase subunit B
MPPVIEEEKCIKCGTCFDVCNYDVYFGTENGELPSVTYPDECWHCNACVLDCPEEAIRLRIPLSAMLLYK